MPAQRGRGFCVGKVCVGGVCVGLVRERVIAVLVCVGMAWRIYCRCARKIRGRAICFSPVDNL